MNNDAVVETSDNKTINDNPKAILRGLKTTDTSTIIYLSPKELQTDICINPANRVINPEKDNHIRRLRKNMRENGYIKDYPIIVNSDLVIQAGHHRYWAAVFENIGAWVKVVDTYDIRERSLAEGLVKKWSSGSWIEYYANQNTGSYPRIREFIKKYGLGVKSAIMILLDKTSEPCDSDFEELAHGTFKVNNWEDAEYKATQIFAFSSICSKPREWKSTHFVAAVLKCLKTEGYDHSSMIEKAKIQSRKLRIQRTRKYNLEMLQEIYNYNRQKVNHLNFVD